MASEFTFGVEVDTPDGPGVIVKQVIDGGSGRGGQLWIVKLEQSGKMLWVFEKQLHVLQDLLDKAFTS